MKHTDAEYYHHVNLDERGSYFADVRKADGETIFEIRAGDSLEEGETSIFEDGFMKNADDMAGLRNYLESLGIIPEGSRMINRS